MSDELSDEDFNEMVMVSNNRKNWTNAITGKPLTDEEWHNMIDCSYIPQIPLPDYIKETT